MNDEPEGPGWYAHRALCTWVYAANALSGDPGASAADAYTTVSDLLDLLQDDLGPPGLCARLDDGVVQALRGEHEGLTVLASDARGLVQRLAAVEQKDAAADTAASSGEPGRAVLLLGDVRGRVAEDDGYLPNGRATGADAAAWRTLLHAFAINGWPVRRHGSPVGWAPVALADLLGVDQATVHVEPAPGVTVNIFPDWGVDTVWFDFDLREIRSQDAADALLDFVRTLARAARRPVLLSYEGADDKVFLEYRPVGDRLVWKAPRG